jgi:hypothetical protein
VPQNLLVPEVQAAGAQLAPPTHTLFVQLQPEGQVMPQSIVPSQPSPIDPQYVPPRGVHETAVLQLTPDAPAVGTLMTGPEAALPVVPA